MSVSETMQALLDAFDNSDQGLAIWDKDDTLIVFNKKFNILEYFIFSYFFERPYPD